MRARAARLARAAPRVRLGIPTELMDVAGVTAARGDDLVTVDDLDEEPTFSEEAATLRLGGLARHHAGSAPAASAGAGSESSPASSAA